MKFQEIVSLIISSVSFGIYLLGKKHIFTVKFQYLVIKILCCLVILRGVSAIVGYIINEEKLTHWFGTVPMPFSSAICFVVLGGCIVWVVSLDKKGGK
jgi:uncharacterized membrane protein YraQ (UPF0718 family)